MSTDDTNSPTPSTKASSAPAMIPRETSGNTTFRKVYHQEAPRLRAASSMFGSICAHAAVEERKTRGLNRTKYAKGTMAKVPTRTRPAANGDGSENAVIKFCLLYTSPSPRD